MMPRDVRRSIFARLLLLQARWSYEGMQREGLKLALEPWLRRVYGKDAEGALARYGACFNTHPFMAPMTVGMLCGLEEQAAAAPAEERAALLKRAEALKTAVSCSLAGLGDALFWGALRPACAAAALVFGMLAGRLYGAPGLAAMALLYLVLYNGPALWLRWRGLELGYEWKGDIAARLKEFSLQSRIRVLKRAAVVLFAVLLLLLLLATPESSARVLGLLAAGGFALVQKLRPRTTAASFYAALCFLGMGFA